MNQLFVALFFAFAFFSVVASSPLPLGTSVQSPLNPSVDQRNLRGLNADGNEEGDKPYVDSMVGSALRHTSQALTTLINVDVDEMNPEEIIFFEDTWVRAFNKVFHGIDSHTIDNENDADGFTPRVRSFVVEDVLIEKTQKENGDRALGRNTPITRTTRWFDVWALVETSCRFCADDRRLMLDSNLLKKKEKANLRQLETELCKLLRQGPFSCFRGLEECRVMYVDDE